MNDPIIPPPTMDTQSPIDTSDLLWVEWTAYQSTPEFANAKKWAEHVQHNYLQGSLWAVYEQGYRTGQQAFDDLAIRLLIKCYDSTHRQSWEEGETEGEVMDSVCAFLWNLGLQPGLPEHESAVKTFMEKK